MTPARASVTAMYYTKGPWRRRRHRAGRRRAASSGERARSLAGGDLLQLVTELGQDLGAVDALGARLADPVLDDGRRSLLDLDHHLGVGVDDLDAGLLEGLQ